MSLAADLNAVYDQVHSNAAMDAFGKPLRQAEAEFAAEFDYEKAIKAGDKLPLFALTDVFGKEVSSAEILAKGPLLITFYRGEVSSHTLKLCIANKTQWCPFCNLALRALQAKLPEFKAAGVTLVAITPQLPDGTLSMTEKHGLEFSVLTDLGNKYAKELGLLMPMPDYLRPVLGAGGLGHDFEKLNGDDSFTLPVPATLLIGKDGVVRNAFVESRFQKRAEPEVIMGWIKELKE